MFIVTKAPFLLSRILYGLRVDIVAGRSCVRMDSVGAWVYTRRAPAFSVCCYPIPYKKPPPDYFISVFDTQQEAESASEECALLARVKFAVDGKAET